MYYKINPLIIFLSVFSMISFIGCEGTSDNATVSIVLPESSGIVVSSSGVTTHSNSGENWNSSLDPVSINDVNCYGVAISGPDAFLRENRVENKTTGEVYEFGVFEAAFPEGSTVVLDGVPSGPDRKIIIVGWKANNGACRDLFLNEPAFDQMSFPYVIGSTQMDLVPGDNDVPVFVSMTGAYAIHNFDGPRFNGIGNGTGGSPGMSLYGDGRDGDVTLSGGVLGSFTYDLMSTSGGDSTSTNKFFNKFYGVNGISSDGATLTVNSAFNGDVFEPGDEIMWHIVSGWAPSSPDTNACAGIPRGVFGFAKVTSTSSNTITMGHPLDGGGHDYPSLNSNLAITPTHGTTHCKMQVVRVPNFNTLTVPPNTYTSQNYNDADGGGMIVFRAKEIILSGDSVFTTTNRGFNSTMNYSGAGFSGPGGTSPDSPNGNGGAIGSSGHGSGGASTAGDGASASSSVPHGMKVDYCGGPCYIARDSKIIYGGAGGGSSENPGGRGGGAIFIHAEIVNGTGSLLLEANGTPGTNGGSYGSGGGAGGSVHMTIREMNLPVMGNARGGGGASHGGGDGAGGVVEMPYCSAQSSSAPTAPDVSAGTGGYTMMGTADNGAALFGDEPGLCN